MIGGGGWESLVRVVRAGHGRLPAFVPLQGRRIIVVGEGEMADGKAVLFEGSPAEVLRMPEGGVALEPQTYAGATLVFIASAEESFAKAAAQAARDGGAMLVNVVDRPALCDFYTPAIVDRGAVVAAVGTTGSGPMLAGRLKNEIDKVTPARVGDLALMLKAIQSAVRARFADFGERKAFLASVLDGPAGAAALTGDAAEGERLARAMLTVSSPPLRGRGQGEGGASATSIDALPAPPPSIPPRKSLPLGEPRQRRVPRGERR